MLVCGERDVERQFHVSIDSDKIDRWKVLNVMFAGKFKTVVKISVRS